MLKESVKYYLDKGNREMFGSSLDLSMEYDRVSHYRLFTKLLDAGCPVYFVKFLRHWYESQSIVVKWNGKCPAPLECILVLGKKVYYNRVCLINIYIDDLLL